MKRSLICHALRVAAVSCLAAPAPALALNLLHLNQIAGLREGDLACALHAAGLTPKGLAACGANEEEASAVVAAAGAALGSDTSAFPEAVADLRAANSEVERLERQARRGVGDPEALAEARAAAASAKSAYDGLIASVRATATAPLSEGERSRLAIFRASLDRPVDDEFKVLTLSEAEWTFLREALSN